MNGGLRTTLSSATWDYLIERGLPRRYPAGSLLMAEGDPGAVVLALVSGQVEIVIGVEEHVATLGPGELVGELSALDGLPRSASVVAKSEVEVRALSAPVLIDALRLHEPTAIPTLRAAAKNTRAATDAAAIEAGGAPVRHLAGWLIDRLDIGSDPKELFVQVDPAEVSEALEIGSELLSRALGHLEAAGALVLDRGRVLVLDLEVLHQLTTAR